MARLVLPTAFELHVRPEWRGPLARAGLTDLQSFLACTAGQAMSTHERGQTTRLTLDGGRTVYLRRDTHIGLKRPFADIVAGRLPLSPSIRELLAIRRLAGLGLRVPAAIAWGQRSLGCLPRQAFLVTLPLEGVDLAAFLAAEKDPARRRGVLDQVAACRRRLEEHGLIWPDMLPKHIYVDGRGRIGLLDLERLCPPRGAAAIGLREKSARRLLAALSACGLSAGEMEAVRRAT